MKLTNELIAMAAYNYGWLQALLHSLRDCSWEELIKRPEIINILANNDENDDVIDIECRDAAYGSIATSIRLDKESGDWYCDNEFDIYDQDNNLVAENITLPCLLTKPESEPIKYVRQVHWSTDGGTRRFKCYNINHYVGAESAADILDEMLAAVGLTLDLSGDYDESIYDLIETAKTKQLKQTIPEVIIEVVGNINDDDIEDMVCNEISEATGWLHEGFEYEEIK